ncbi:NAD-dependent epimerase/dehydratase family protein [Microbacterium dextranolyticum]|uniref:NAD-dependent epimerase n=1 Tax=Microbacterium dextranolyticum TaxID=36806 RepID=A0A9W6M7C5_9MICO|nr:NAD(P)-dependent oxidoreductase [Microbacterium dextranolyticum]MBM7462550.1 nucleoside-diphosphate-sugar epimerase [Microbacterium dextranolyticum]GLJ96408.1 NAD-dependent epimerase [Microbacterium dextranolyticum]
MILVTGGLGMIGANTAAALADLGENVLITGHRRSEVPSFLADRVAVETLDLTDTAAFLALGDRYDIDGIVHLAGSIPEPDPMDFFRRDTAALFNALNAARQWRVRRFAVASSISVYEGRSEIPYSEDLALPLADIPHAIGAFKKALEPLVQFALADTNVQPVLLRIGSTWGPLMDPESPFNPIPRTVSALLRGERPPAMHADDGGDFGYARDTGRAIALLATAPTLRHTAYNVGGGFRYTNRELADALNAALPGQGIEVVNGRSTGPGEDPYLDTSRLTTETGFAPRFDLAGAITDYVAWRRKNPR